jgi:hypothetical protein
MAAYGSTKVDEVKVDKNHDTGTIRLRLVENGRSNRFLLTDATALALAEALVEQVHSKYGGKT